MKKLKAITAIGLALTMLMGSVTAFAEKNNAVADLPEGVTIEETDPYIKKMMEDYENGVFVERNESDSIRAIDIFEETSVLPLDDGETDDTETVNLYDLHKTGEDTYEATKVSIIRAVDDTIISSKTKNGVTMFCTISFEVKTINGCNCVMLNRVKGGVSKVTQTYECEEMRIGYGVMGETWDKNGNKVGNISQYSDPSDYVISNPIVGPAYSIAGPGKYYYNMVNPESKVAGIVEGLLVNSSGREAEIEIRTEVPNE